MPISSLHTQTSHTQDETDSLPSTEISDYTSIYENSDAQEEWETSLQQLEMVLTMVIVPYVGKYIGRKFAYWSRYSKYVLNLLPIVNVR